MSETVSGAVIVSTLGDPNLTFIPLSALSSSPEWVAGHINGALHSDPAQPALLVEFRSLQPDPPMIPTVAAPEPPSSVAGYIAPEPQDFAPALGGALQQNV
jgi:hypothetical protein